MTAAFRTRAHCALCQADRARLEPVLRLAPTPPANEFVAPEAASARQETFPLTLLLCCDCGHLQLDEIVDPVRLFGNYVYVSGTSPVFVEKFRKYANTLVERFRLGPEAFVVEVGSNDGTLLKQFQRAGVTRVLGIDPATAIAREAEKAGVPTLATFFDRDIAKRVRDERGAADAIVANNVFAHAEDLRGFASAVGDLLAPDGVFVFEVSYLVDVAEKLLFDTIYHEHLAYHTVAPLVGFFRSLGLRLFDVERVETHGGSLRGYVCRSDARHATNPRVDQAARAEAEMGLFTPAYFRELKERIAQRGAQLRNAIADVRGRGARLAGFGAPAKLTTLMHEFALGRDDIEFIVDDSRWKQGLLTPGTHIPVVAPPLLRDAGPRWCVVFAWNFADSIIARQQEYVAAGGRFIIPLPELKIV